MLMLVYGISSNGMTLQLHYCCGKLKKVDFSIPKEKDCNKSNKHKMGSKPCCDTKPFVFKINKDLLPAKVVVPHFQSFVLPPLVQEAMASNPVIGKKLLPEVFASPPVSAPPRYIIHCTFLI
jgi:hypothetical protein